MDIHCENCNADFKLEEKLFRMSDKVCCPICKYEIKNRYDVLNSDKKDKLK